MLQTRMSNSLPGTNTFFTPNKTSGTFVELKYRFFFFLKLTSFLFLSLRTDHKAMPVYAVKTCRPADPVRIEWCFRNHRLLVPLRITCYLLQLFNLFWQERVEKLFSDIVMEWKMPFVQDYSYFSDGLCFNLTWLSRRIIFRYNFNMLNEK